ncbi:MAG: NAD(P)-dependent oxidoreductase [Flavobacteriales bacterium]
MQVYVIDTVHESLWNILSEKGFDCHDVTSMSKEEFFGSSALQCEGIVIRSRFKLLKEELSQLPNLKFIARSGAGLENIDLDYCSQHGIKVYNSPEGNMTAVAEHAIGMILTLFNHLKRGDSEVKKAIWNRELNRGLELEGKTVGIIGYGNMGSAFAKRLSGFGCTVLAYDKYKSNFSSNLVKEVSLLELQNEADIVSLHIPISEETQYFVNTEFIGTFKKSFYLINTARGNHVSIKDLLPGLESGKVLGACLDVLEYEKFNFETISPKSLPEDWKKLVSHRNVILSPHVAGWTQESYIKLSTFLAEKILKDWA